DPGTGAYYADEKVRNYLTSWGAHNAPHIVGLDWPRRLGAFLWSEHHPPPTWEAAGANKIIGRLRLPDVPRDGKPPILLSRSIARVESGDGWLVQDIDESGTGTMAVRWQFPPGVVLTECAKRLFQLERNGQSIWIEAEAPEAIAHQPEQPGS